MVKIHFQNISLSKLLLPGLFLVLSLLYFSAYSQTNSQRKYPRRQANTQTSTESEMKKIDTGNKFIRVEGITLPAVIEDGDTLFIYELDELIIFAPREFDSRMERLRYTRLLRNVKKVYPYAKLAGEKFKEYNKILLEEENEIRRNILMRQAEDELRASFEQELRRLTFSQGIILVKLIDRETQNTTYEILKEFRGVASAVFWQGIGRIFGYNLRTEYDAEGEDKMIEEIVLMIEAGAI